MIAVTVIALTETDALSKWCPLSSDRQTSCIGTQCMAWRWQESPPERNAHYLDRIELERLHKTGQIPRRPDDVRASWEFDRGVTVPSGAWVEPFKEWQARWKGTCGLAGRSA